MNRRRYSVWLRAFCIVLAFGLLAFAPTACGKKGPSKMRFAGIVFQEDQFFQLVERGMEQAAKENNIEMLLSCSNSKPEKEIELINTYVSQQVDAILISPYSKEGSVTALKLAKDQGITVVAENTPIAGDVAAAYIECSATDLGEQTGKVARKYILDKLKGKAKVAIVAFKSQVPEQSDERVNGFKSQISDLPGVKIVAEQDAWLPEMAVKKVTDILTANPDIDMIWSANEGGTIGSVLAVKNAGKAGKIVVFGTDSSQQLIDFLLSPDNILQAITSQRPYEVGRMAVEDAIKVKKGQPVVKRVSLKGILLDRAEPDKVQAFKSQLDAWIKK